MWLEINMHLGAIALLVVCFFCWGHVVADSDHSAVNIGWDGQPVTHRITEGALVQSVIQAVKEEVTKANLKIHEELNALKFSVETISANVEDTLKEEVSKMSNAVQRISDEVANRFEKGQMRLSGDIASGITTVLDRCGQIDVTVADAKRELAVAEGRVTDEIKSAVKTIASSVPEAAVHIWNRVDNTTQVIASDVRHLRCLPENCGDVQRRDNIGSGLYNVFIGAKLVQVYCDFDTDGGGWTVFQRRSSDDASPGVDFYRGWTAYKEGFGKLRGEFWLGLDNIHALTSSTPVRLRVDLEDWEGGKAYAEYDTFRIEGEEDQYRLVLSGYDEGRGGAGDSLMGTHSGMKFSTRDNDNDLASTTHCAEHNSGAWWYNKCHSSNLNGRSLKGNAAGHRGLVWKTWKGQSYSLKTTEMKVRPRNS